MAETLTELERELRRACRATVDALLAEYQIPTWADDEYIYDTMGSRVSSAFFQCRAAAVKAEAQSHG